MSNLANVPQIIEHRRDTLNGHYPSATFYGRVVTGLNHLMAYRHKQVFAYAANLGDPAYGVSGTNVLARWRWRSSCAATYARIVLVLGKDNTGGVATDPSVTVTLDGNVYGPYAWGQSATATDDEPDQWRVVVDVVQIVANALLDGSIETTDYARVLSATIFELGEPTVSESTDYYSGESFGADSPIYDAAQGRLLEGLTESWRKNAGTLVHWGRPDSSPRTRTSATPANLVDGTTTGAPTAATPGVTLDLSYRCTEGRATVPVELWVYAETLGTGTVELVDSGGTVVATVSIPTSGPDWFTATALLPSTADKYDLRFAGDGSKALSVYAVSLGEWE